MIATMSSTVSNEQALRAENAELRAQLAEMEETLRAIRAGEVDALVVESAAGPQVFILQTADAESNRFRSDILAKLNDTVIAIDDDQRVIYLNAAAERQYGVTASEALGRSLTALYQSRWFHPEDEERAAAALREAGHWQGKNIHIKSDGKVIHVESSVSRLLGKDGTPSGLLSVIRDITDRSAAEEALRDSERRFRQMIDALPVAIYTTDAEGRLTHFNPACVEMSGREPKLDTDQWCVSWKLYHADGTPMPLDECPMAIALKEGRAVRGVEVIAERPDGTRMWFTPYPTPLRDAEGRVTGGINMLLDITERRELESSLVERAEELARADRSKDEFLAMLAHELRNPLAPLRNASEILHASGVSDEERAQAHGILGRQIENMSRMIDDLLDVSRINEGKISLHREPVELGPILTAAASLARSNCSANGQELEVSLPAEPVFLNADATRLEQVFGNLLSNACKYSGDGCHIWLTAERSTGVEPPEVVVRVCDDGVGIDPELLPRVFDLFVQATRALDRAHGGLGIGLTLVQRLVNLHGGSIEARSEGPGRGAEFIVRLPILSKVPPLSAPGSSVGDGPPRRILIVDDNTDSSRSLAILQSRRGHTTRTAATGPDALSAAAEFLPEVVLLDIGLPGMDGFEVARQLRATPALEKAFLIAMSGYGRDEDRVEARLAGFDEYLVKPINLDLLRDWLQRRA